MIRDSNDEHTRGLQAPQALNGSAILHPKEQRQAPLDPKSICCKMVTRLYHNASILEEIS